MTRNDGKDFEKEVALFFGRLLADDRVSVVSKNEFIASPDGVRQIDVLVRTNVAGEELLTVIECKDLKAPANVMVVDALHSKMQDINANKGIIASRSGFSRTAIQKAKRLGISLCTIDKASNKLFSPASALPIVATPIKVESFAFDFASQENSGRHDINDIDYNQIVPNFGVLELLRFIPTKELLSKNPVELDVTSEMIAQPLSLLYDKTKSIPLKYFRLKFNLSNSVYFGYASDLPSSVVKIDEIKNTHDVLLTIEDFDKLSGNFAQFETIEHIPQHLRKSYLSVLTFPTSVQEIGSVKVKSRPEKGGPWTTLRDWQPGS